MVISTQYMLRANTRPADMVSDHVLFRRTRTSSVLVTQELTKSCHVTTALEVLMLRHAALMSVQAQSSSMNYSGSPVVSTSAKAKQSAR